MEPCCPSSDSQPQACHCQQNVEASSSSPEKKCAVPNPIETSGATAVATKSLDSRNVSNETLKSITWPEKQTSLNVNSCFDKELALAVEDGISFEDFLDVGCILKSNNCNSTVVLSAHSCFCPNETFVKKPGIEVCFPCPINESLESIEYFYFLNYINGFVSFSVDKKQFYSSSTSCLLADYKLKKASSVSRASDHFSLVRLVTFMSKSPEIPNCFDLIILKDSIITNLSTVFEQVFKNGYKRVVFHICREE